MANRIEQVFLPDGEIQLGDKEDGLVWKEIIRTGQWKYRPGPDGRPIDRPLKIVKENAGDDEYAISDIYEAFKDGAVENVTVPATHKDGALENTGFVKDVKISDDGTRLLAAHEFTEGDVKGKVTNGSVRGNSVALMPNYTRKSDGKQYKVAMLHNSLTNHPWIDGLGKWGLAASEEVDEVVAFEPQEEETTEVTLSQPKIVDGKLVISLPFDPNSIPQHQPVSITQNFSMSGESTETPVKTSVPRKNSPTAPNTPEFRLQESQSNRTIHRAKKVEGGKPMSDTIRLEDLELTDEARQQIEARLEEFSSDRSELDKLRKEKRDRSVEDRIEDLKGMGLDAYPGFLKEVRSIYLSDDGGTALLLSEDTGKAELTASQIVDRLIGSLPAEDGKIKLSEQVVQTPNSDEKPDKDTSNEISHDDRVKLAQEYLGLAD